MSSSIRQTFLGGVLFAIVAVTHVEAAPILYRFEAQVFQNAASGLPPVGSIVSGSFWYDTTGTITRNDITATRQAIALDHAPPAGQPGISLEFGGSGPLESTDSTTNTGLVNNSPAEPLVDQMIVQSRSFMHGLIGIPDDVQMQVNFTSAVGEPILENNGVPIPTSLPIPGNLPLDPDWNFSRLVLRDRTGVLNPGSIFFGADFTTLVAVPEPATLAMLGAGVLAGLWSRRRGCNGSKGARI